jgi:hypothetical protein
MKKVNPQCFLTSIQNLFSKIPDFFRKGLNIPEIYFLHRKYSLATDTLDMLMHVSLEGVKSLKFNYNHAYAIWNNQKMLKNNHICIIKMITEIKEIELLTINKISGIYRIYRKSVALRPIKFRT